MSGCRPLLVGAVPSVTTKCVFEVLPWSPCCGVQQSLYGVADEGIHADQGGRIKGRGLGVDLGWVRRHGCDLHPDVFSPVFYDRLDDILLVEDRRRFIFVYDETIAAPTAGLIYCVLSLVNKV